jgi:hypothetical protein
LAFADPVTQNPPPAPVPPFGVAKLLVMLLLTKTTCIAPKRCSGKEQRYENVITML